MASDIAKQMQALFIESGALVWRDTPIPAPEADEVLVKAAYAGLNRADLFQRDGSYPAPDNMPNIPGLEISGIVAACGRAVTQWQVGDPVCALLSGGGYATYAVAKASHCLPPPDGLTLREAASLPEACVTVWMALFDQAGIKPHESILVHGGASGIGVMAIQMLKAFGCSVWATAGTEDKCARCESLGATAIHYRSQDFVEIIRVAGGVDVILDMVGGDYINRNFKSLKLGGRLVSLAFLQGNRMQVNAAGLLMKRLSWIGTTLRSRSDGEKAAYIADIRKYVWPWIAEGLVKPVIDRVYPIAEAADAHERMQNYLHCGKILLQISNENAS